MSHLILLFALIWILHRALKGRREYDALKVEVAGGNPGALELFIQAALQRKLLTALVVGLLMTRVPVGLPFNLPNEHPVQTLAWIVGLFVMVGLSILYFRKRGSLQLRFLFRTAGALVPISRRQRHLFLLFSLAAGVEEELLFRWLITNLFISSLELEAWPALLASSLVFGTAHLYQGWRGVIATSLLGYVFAYLWLESGTLWVPMAAHVVLDARIAAILTPKRLQELEPAPLAGEQDPV